MKEMDPSLASAAPRFWAQVRKSDGCWEWQGGLNKKGGYGQIQVGGRHTLAHRVSWRLAHHGEAIPIKRYVLHRCDNTRCVNPGHLFLGTHAENMRDMMRKGRGTKARGERHGRARVTSRVVRTIREMSEEGSSQRQIARAFGISRRCVQHILAGNTWAHVPTTTTTKE